jgi:hypothetical protein
MYLNGFRVFVPEGKENGSGQVAIEHGSKYAIGLSNSNNVDADAEVWISGKKQGEWRIRKHSTIYLYRPTYEDGCFTAVDVNSAEAKEAGVVDGPDSGLITVVFKPGVERVRPVESVTYWASTPNPYGNPQWIYYGSTTDSEGTKLRCCNATYAAAAPAYSAAGTVLTGHSGQQFYTVAPLSEYGPSVTVNLRLVISRSARPVQNVGGYSTPIPPRA